MELQFNPHARRELEDATAYYLTINPSLGDYFANEAERVISMILRLPEAFPSVAPSVRRCRMKRFPYGVVYRIKGNCIEIIAVMHLSRRPLYWTER